MKFKHGDPVYIKDKFFPKETKGKVVDYKIKLEGTQGQEIKYEVSFMRTKKWFDESKLKSVS